jgi:hypothetical protein
MRTTWACWLGAGVGYGVSAPAAHAAAAEPHPKGDGLWLMNTTTGDAKLLLSLQSLYVATFDGKSVKTLDIPASLHSAHPKVAPRQHQPGYPA